MPFASINRSRSCLRPVVWIGKPCVVWASTNKAIGQRQPRNRLLGLRWSWMSFDAVVAGAGIIGASIAWRLAQQRMRVLLLDKDRLGGEASSAGAGMLAPGGEVEEHSTWGDLAAEGLRLYPAFVAELEDESGLHIDFQRLGAVELALSRGEWTALQARAERQSALGVPSCPLDAADLRKHVPLARQDVRGALFYPQDSLVDPRDVTAALRAAC